MYRGDCTGVLPSRRWRRRGGSPCARPRRRRGSTQPRHRPGQYLHRSRDRDGPGVRKASTPSGCGCGRRRCRWRATRRRRCSRSPTGSSNCSPSGSGTLLGASSSRPGPQADLPSDAGVTLRLSIDQVAAPSPSIRGLTGSIAEAARRLHATDRRLGVGRQQEASGVGLGDSPSESVCRSGTSPRLAADRRGRSAARRLSRGADPGARRPATRTSCSGPAAGRSQVARWSRGSRQKAAVRQELREELGVGLVLGMAVDGPIGGGRTRGEECNGSGSPRVTGYRRRWRDHEQLRWLGPEGRLERRLWLPAGRPIPRQPSPSSLASRWVTARRSSGDLDAVVIYSRHGFIWPISTGGPGGGVGVGVGVNGMRTGGTAYGPGRRQ